MLTKRQVLGEFKCDEFLDVFDLEVSVRRQRAFLVETLGASRKAKLDAISPMLRARLKEICQALDLDDSGHEIDESLARLHRLKKECQGQDCKRGRSTGVGYACPWDFQSRSNFQ